MQTQNRLFSICVSKMVIYTYKKKIASTNQAFLSFSQQNCNLRWQNGNLSQQNIFLYYYFLLSYSKFQQQTKLIPQCLYLLMINSTCQFFCYRYDPCHACHLQKECKRNVIAQKQQNTLNRAQSSSSYSQQKTWVKKVIVNASKFVDFVSFGSLRNSSTT